MTPGHWAIEAPFKLVISSVSCILQLSDQVRFPKYTFYFIDVLLNNYQKMKCWG